MHRSDIPLRLRPTPHRATKPGGPRGSGIPPVSDSFVCPNAQKPANLLALSGSPLKKGGQALHERCFRGFFVSRFGASPLFQRAASGWPDVSRQVPFPAFPLLAPRLICSPKPSKIASSEFNRPKGVRRIAPNSEALSRGHFAMRPTIELP
jgi:hypothetical protein